MAFVQSSVSYLSTHYYICALFTFVSSVGSVETFHEELLLRPLPTGDVMAFFNFVTVASIEEAQTHFHLLPRVVGEWLHEHSLLEMDLSLTRGVWRAKEWAYPPRSAPTGAFLSARFSPEKMNGTSPDQAWVRLAHTLSGQFCASLNYLDSSLTFNPKWSFSANGVVPENDVNGDDSTHFRAGVLAGENVCTENLTPLKKLLPCDSKRGLSTLLNAKQIHRARYHSLGLSLRRVCRLRPDESCIHPQIELSQYAVFVFDPWAFPENWGSGGRTDDGDRLNSYNWSVRSLFGIGIQSSCPLATGSAIYFDLQHKNDATIQPSSAPNIELGAIRVFDTEKLLIHGVHNLIFTGWKPNDIIKPPVLHVTRYLTGHGQAKGGIVTAIHNTGPQMIRVVYLDVVPWFLRVYFHTLKVENSHSELHALLSRFVPGVDRERPYSLELVLDIPAMSKTEISVGFEHSILKWHEYPPDANKGFHVGSAVVTALLHLSEDVNNFTNLLRGTSTFGETFQRRFSDVVLGDQLELVRLYTESLLVFLPTPDFSMPYNVICLTCTVVALAFGPLVNITTKFLVIVNPADEVAQSSGLLAKVKGFLGFKVKRTRAEKDPPMGKGDNSTSEIGGK